MVRESSECAMTILCSLSLFLYVSPLHSHIERIARLYLFIEYHLHLIQSSVEGSIHRQTFYYDNLDEVGCTHGFFLEQLGYSSGRTLLFYCIGLFSASGRRDGSPAGDTVLSISHCYPSQSVSSGVLMIVWTICNRFDWPSAQSVASL